MSEASCHAAIVSFSSSSSLSISVSSRGSGRNRRSCISSFWRRWSPLEDRSRDSCDWFWPRVRKLSGDNHGRSWTVWRTMVWHSLSNGYVRQWGMALAREMMVNGERLPLLSLHQDEPVHRWIIEIGISDWPGSRDVLPYSKSDSPAPTQKIILQPHLKLR
jgi:hypothetical protein